MPLATGGSQAESSIQVSTVRWQTLQATASRGFSASWAKETGCGLYSNDFGLQQSMAEETRALSFLSIASMQHTQLTEHVRELVRTELARLGLAEEEPHETILLADGHYAGRRFEAACGYALWFLEEGQIKVYRSGGQLAKTLRLSASPREAARAA